MESVVSVEWLHARRGRDDVVVADCRFDLNDPRAGRRAYTEAHIPGAVFFDLDEDLSRPPSPTGRGGRHPLPPWDEFVALLSSRGIGDGVSVVAYDDSGGGMAARLWWMLRFLGHDAVALLDGGFPAWQAAGLPTEKGAGPVRPPRPRPFTVRWQHDMAVSAQLVHRMVEEGRGTIVDSRAPERYRGEVEPLDPVAGRIPGAINFPWEGNLDTEGRFLSRHDLAQRFSSLAPSAPSTEADEDIVVHCGSGVTGCLNVLALERAGFKGVKLYVGGWSEWCSDPDNPVASGPSEDS